MFSLYFSLKWIISIVASCWGGYHLPKMFEKIMFYCLKEGQKGSNWAQYIVPWPNTKHPLQNLLETINTAWNTVWRVPNIMILLWVNHMKPLKTLKMDILTEILTRCKPKTWFFQKLESNLCDFSDCIFSSGNHLGWIYRNCSSFINF